MSGYKRVNYYELCRLCTSTEGMKTHIFKEDGRRKQLTTKIRRCLPLKVQEFDLLPKMICHNCQDKLEELDNFRNLCLEAEKMLQDFRSKLKPTLSGSGEKLQVYVKDSPSHTILPSKKQQPTTEKTQETCANSTQTQQQILHDAEKRVIALMTMPRRLNEETRQVPLQCSLPLKINGVPSSVVPVNVDNLSSLMQIVPQSEISRIQKFGIPMQSEITVVNETSDSHYNVTLPSSELMQKEASNIIQTLQCTVTNNGNINMNKMSIQSNGPSNGISFNSASMPVSLISSSHPTVTQNGLVQDVVMQVNLKNEDVELKSPTCHLYQEADELCDENVIQPVTSVHSQSSCTTSVIQSNPIVYNTNKTPKWLFPEDHGGFKCDTCGKPFRKKEHLFQHRKLHTGVRPYVCGSCGKSFSRKEHLFRHTLAHTGEKRHLCTLCGKTFSRKDNLHKHRRTHGITGPYECELCGKSFIVKHYFLMHQANHSTDDNEEFPFQCDICKKGFVKEEFLNTHKVRHRVRTNQRVPATTPAPEEVIVSNAQVDDDSLGTAINSVAILSSNGVQQNICSDNTIYISAQPSTFTLTTTAACNTTTATQTPLFSADLGTDGQLLENYRHLGSTTAVSS